MDKKNSSKFVIILMGSLVLVSLVTAWIMGRNYAKDTSKDRKVLTEALKKFQKEEFVFDQQRGLKGYGQFCLRCHGAQGEGSVSAPPLAGAEFATGDKERLVKVVAHGMTGRIERNGRVYNLSMPAFPMIPNQDLAHLLTYIRKNFGNQAQEVTPVDVVKIKMDHVEREKPWTPEEL